MKINAYKCKECGDIIYSRARHDMRYCSCGNIFVDGGFDYFRGGAKISGPESADIDIDITKQELFDDWNNRTDKYGIIKEPLDAGR